MHVAAHTCKRTSHGNVTCLNLCSLFGSSVRVEFAMTQLFAAARRLRALSSTLHAHKLRDHFAVADRELLASTNIKRLMTSLRPPCARAGQCMLLLRRVHTYEGAACPSKDLIMLCSCLLHSIGSYMNIYTI